MIKLYDLDPINKLDNLLRDYYNNINCINKIIYIILSYNEYISDYENIYYIGDPSYIDYKINSNHTLINEVLDEYQHKLDYNILSNLIYEKPEIIHCIDLTHKHYQELYELYMFLKL
jgi:hypothetical protein